MDLKNKIEAILFYKGEPVSLRKLTEMFKVSEEEISGAIEELRLDLTGRGIVLQEKEDKYMLGTAPEMGEMIEAIRKEELDKGLSKASLETLAVVLYKNGAPRAYIDYVRGVNSSFILRSLSIRGLVEKVEDPNDKRRYIYKPTFELLAFMGVSRVEELPNYEEMVSKFDASFEEAQGGEDEE